MARAVDPRWPAVLEDASLTEISLKQQIGAVKREIALRDNVYPKWIPSLSEEGAAKEQRLMRAVLRTLLILQRETEAGTAPELSFFERGK